MKDVAVVAYCRTGIAKAGRGALNATHGIPLAAHVLRNVAQRAGIDAGEVEDVVLGCGLPEGATGHNIARNAALEAGFGIAVSGVTINRYCGSGLTAASIAANRIANGEANTIVAGGVESISLVQFNLNLNGFAYEPAGKAYAVGVVDDEPDRRFCGQEIQHHTRSARYVRRRKPEAGRRCGGSGKICRRDRAV